MKQKQLNATKIFYGIFGFLLMTFIAYSCSNAEESNVENQKIKDKGILERSNDPYEDVVITIYYENQKLMLKDNQNNPYDPSKPEDFTTEIYPEGNVTWELGTGLDSISIAIDSGQSLFAKLPEEETNGDWTADMDDVQSGTAKYDITYKVSGDSTVYVLDPKLQIRRKSTS
ncbi:hypothetical protein [Winogradskyella sp. 3972H.M.0a.05]|uniref:hypothetical protein n=1 Tax=Winogradskyella sp. 3972H.M.0a.05 TaxID=2950277 RepID=UPI003396F386